MIQCKFTVPQNGHKSVLHSSESKTAPFLHYHSTMVGLSNRYIAKYPNYLSILPINPSLRSPNSYSANFLGEITISFKDPRLINLPILGHVGGSVG